MDLRNKSGVSTMENFMPIIIQLLLCYPLLACTPNDSTLWIAEGAGESEAFSMDISFLLQVCKILTVLSGGLEQAII